jgi:hypothetical protein
LRICFLLGLQVDRRINAQLCGLVPVAATKILETLMN